MSFLIEEIDIILVKYYTLFLTICYSQLVFIRVFKVLICGPNFNVEYVGPISPRQWICREWVEMLGLNEFGQQLSQVQIRFELNFRDK